MKAGYTWLVLDETSILAHFPPQLRTQRVRPGWLFDSNTYSCYDNFVPSGKYGVPSFVDYNSALLHLKILLRHLSARIDPVDPMTGATRCAHSTATDSEPRSTDSVPNFDAGDVTLLGFSKGCVVLNQFIRELHYLRGRNASVASREEDDFVSRIRDMYFLDGGHAGRNGTWVTDSCMLRTLSELEIEIHVHVTPYQVDDVRRPWIGKEEKIFTETLRELNANIARQLHFENEPASLDRHFEILTVFS